MKDKLQPPQQMSRRTFLTLGFTALLAACSRPFSGGLPTPVATGTPRPTNTLTPTETLHPSETPTPTFTPTITPVPPTSTELATVASTITPTSTDNSLGRRAGVLADHFNIPKERVRQELTGIITALTQAGVEANIIYDSLSQNQATNPVYTEGVTRDQTSHTITTNYPEAATSYVSFGGGQILDEGDMLKLILPNGVFDFSDNPSMISPTRQVYPYASQVYQVINATRSGPDVLPPTTPDQDQNKRVVVVPNSGLEYAYVAHGGFQSAGSMTPRSIGSEWLAEQLFWGTGGGTNCGTGCNEVSLVLITEQPIQGVEMTQKVIQVVHVSRIIEADGITVNYRAKIGSTEKYDQEGVAKTNQYFEKNVLPTWPATPTPAPSTTPTP